VMGMAEFQRFNVKPSSDNRGALCVLDGKRQVPHRIARTYSLYEVPEGINVPPMVWTDLHNFLPSTMVLCPASLPYDEADYIRDRHVYLKEISSQWRSPSSI